MKSALTIMMKTCPCLLLLVLFLGCAGALNGQGTYTYPSGNVYTGNFADNKRQGQGTLKFASGNEYTGNWVDSKMQGQGTYKFASGDEYTGNFVDDEMQGQGTFKFASGDGYTGNFVDGKKQGQGTYKFANGEEHTGNFVGDKTQGQGTYTLADGTRFEGEWQGDTLITGTQISASGTRVSANGTRLAKLDGKVVILPQQAAAAPPTQPVAKTQAAFAAPSAQPMTKASPVSSSGASSGRVCDTQCGMIVAESRCKQVQDNRDNLSCMTKNGMMLPDTPELCAAAKALSGCVTQAEKETAQKQEIPDIPRHYNHILLPSFYAKKSACDLAIEEWRRRGHGQINKIMDKYKSSIISKAMIKVYEVNLKIYELCANDDAEFKDEAHHAILGLKNLKDNLGVNCGGLLGTGGPDEVRRSSNALHRTVGETQPAYESRLQNYLQSYRCELGPPTNGSELDEYFPVFERNGLAAVAWAKTVKAGFAAASDISPSPEDQACAASLKSIDKQFYRAQKDVPLESIVVLSESVLWAVAESTAKIKAQCPQSVKYQGQLAQLDAANLETQRVCDAHASSPPCVPRLPGKEPAPAPQAAAPLKPLQNKPPAGCESGGAQGGANFKHCLAVACEKQQHKFEDSGGGCFTCDRGGSDQWTRCTSGFGSAR